MKMTTTFARLKQARACTSVYSTLAKHLGSVEEYGEDKEINLLTILDSSGLGDALWCLRATVQDCDKEKRLIACEFAESVLHIFESQRPNDDRPRKSIEAAKQFANGEISKDEMRVARRAVAVADVAAADVAVAAADVAVAAADVAVAAAVYSAVCADDAVYYTAVYAAAASKQKKEKLAEIFRKHLQD